MSGRIVIIQGGQYGSEGKGQVAAEIARRESIGIAVRTGSINAGHTVHKDGRPFVMQIVPTPWVNPGTRLVLGAGTYIEPDVLDREVEMIRVATGEDIRGRLFIDHRCAWFGEDEAERAKRANRHHAMGATGKGCSEAVISKIKDRGAASPESRLFINTKRGEKYKACFTDTIRLLNSARDAGQDILLEGTQGSLLDFITGPYPFVTNRSTNAAAWLAEAGLPPVNVDVVLVVRSHPIRVAGNSGPMPGETTWPELAKNINRRLIDRGMPPAVEPWAIAEFERMLLATMQEHYPQAVEALGPRAIRFDKWTEAERSLFRVALSESNSLALKSLPDDTVAALKFFEKTTVTKKLRRIANLSASELQFAISMNAPSRIVYTFLNYDFPELTNSTSRLHAEALERMSEISRILRVPVQYVTTGPLPEHMLAL